MINCDEVSDRMPVVVSGRAAWSSVEAAHLAECADCAAEWRLVRAGYRLHAGLAPDSEIVVQQVLARLRAAATVVPLRRLPWRNFGLGLAAAASIALAVWVPSRRHETVAVNLPSRIGPKLPTLSSVTTEQLDRISLASEHRVLASDPGSVPHLGDLTEGDLEQLSGLTENP